MLGRRIAPQKQITMAQAENQLVRFLTECRIEKLRALTVDDLLRTHRVTPKVAEYRLTIAKQNRAGEV